MNWLDWLALSMGLVTIVGGTIDGNDLERELNRPSAAQVASNRPATAGVTVGGDVLLRFADSGVMAAEDRAREARLNLRRAVDHFGLPKGYFGPGLRVVGGGDVAEIHYLDLRLTTATAADAKANGFDSAGALANRWRGDLDKVLRSVPAPLPDNWFATAGKATGAVLVSDETLASVAAASLPGGVGGVRVSAVGGVIVLEGQVRSATDKARLVRLMRDVPGAQGVEDKLAVAR
jgi:hypothetical protein